MTIFDALAPRYDTDFTQHPIGRMLRARVQARLLKHFSVGDHLLELGCGTGEDACFLAKHGMTITATDASTAMCALAEEKNNRHEQVQVCMLDLAQLPDWNGHQFDGVFSNFGALNCLADWQPLAQWLSDKVPSGATVCLGIMAPFCAWEFMWHMIHGKFDIALRRVRGDDFGDLRITYPTIRRITDDFSPDFRRVHVSPLGLFLPTSGLFDVVQKRPRLMTTLSTLEKRFQDVSQLALFADHYWIEFEKL